MADIPISDSSELNPAQPRKEKEEEEEDGDPGIIIILNDDAAIHACLQLLAAGSPLLIGYPVVPLAPGR